MSMLAHRIRRLYSISAGMMAELTAEVEHDDFFTSDSPSHAFIPTNARKRPLSPITAATIPSPSKRSATQLFGDATASPEYFSTSSTIDFSYNGSVDANNSSNLEPRASPGEIPDTPSGSFLCPVNTTESSFDISWMDEFVNFGQGDHKGLFPIAQTSEPYDEFPRPWTAVKSEEPEKVAAEHVPSSKEDYFLDESDEEDMMKLMGSPDMALSEGPSASLIQRTERDSTSPARLNPQLQHSTSNKSHRPHLEDSLAEPNLLDEEVDWDLVTACVVGAPTSPDQGRSTNVTSPALKTLPNTAPLSRPPFPEKMRDRSLVVGFSSTVVLRICFRIGELLNAHTKCSRDKQDVVLELFARVTYSNRESTAKAQHFQLKDLFTDRQPFLSGALKGWRVGGLIDEQSKVFLGRVGKDKLCRCICRLSDDKKSPIGRSATILSIRETDWDEIQWALKIVARDAASADDGQEEMTSSEM